MTLYYKRNAPRFRNHRTRGRGSLAKLLGRARQARVRPMFLVACVGRILDAANTRKNEALGASVMRRSATSNLTPKFRRRARQAPPI